MLKLVLVLIFSIFTNFTFASESILKIAIIGGSAARGYDGLRGLQEILTADFKHYFPVKKIEVKLLAGLTNPDPFYRGQALVLRNEIDNYDVFIIYTGNTEVKNYLHDSQIFIKKEFRAQYPIYVNHFPNHERQNTGPEPSFFQRLYLRVKNKLISLGYIEKEITESHQTFPRFPRLAEDRVPPQKIFLQSLTDFSNELEAIVKLGNTKNKKFIISTLPSSLNWRPWFSFGDKNNAAELHFEKGKKLLNEGKFDSAFTVLKEARDLDGFFTRTVSAQHQSLRTIALGNKNSSFLDSEELLLKIIKNKELTFEQLFSSMQHASFLGNIIVSRALFCSIIEQNQDFFKNDCPLRKEKIEYRDLENLYLARLSVPSEEIGLNYFMIARWHLALSDLAAMPDDFYNWSLFNLAQYKKYTKSSRDLIKYYLYSSLAQLKLGNKVEAKQLANLALEQGKTETLNELYAELPNSLPFYISMKNGGLSYSKLENKFDLK